MSGYESCWVVEEWAAPTVIISHRSLDGHENFVNTGRGSLSYFFGKISSYTRIVTFREYAQRFTEIMKDRGQQ